MKYDDDKLKVLIIQLIKSYKIFLQYLGPTHRTTLTKEIEYLKNKFFKSSNFILCKNSIVVSQFLSSFVDDSAVAQPTYIHYIIV